MTIDWTINIGQLLTVGGFLAGGIAFVFAVKSDVKIIDVRLESVEKTLEKVGTVMLSVARHDVLIDGLGNRLDTIESVPKRNGHT